MKIKNNNIFVEYNELIESEIKVFSHISCTYELIKTIRANKLFKEIMELDIIKNIHDIWTITDILFGWI